MWFQQGDKIAEAILGRPHHYIMEKGTRVGGGVLLVLLALVFGYTFWETFNLTYEHRLVSAERDAPLKNVTIYRNGHSTGGVQVQVSAEVLSSRTGEGELAAYLSQFIAVEDLNVPAAQESKETEEASHEKELNVPGAVADRVYNGRGELLKTYRDLLSGDRLYLVAPGLLFVWPFVELGHRVTLPFKENSTKAPMILESISESPRVFRLLNFFSGDEADKLIERTLAIDDPQYKLQESTVGDFDGNNKRKKSNTRTSMNAFDTVSETAVNIRKRVFDVLSLGEFNEDMCDGLQLLRYQQKQAYIAHHDYFPIDAVSDYNYDPHTGGSNRFATVFMYLSDVELGGQTVFPKVNMPEGLPANYLHPLNVEDFEASGVKLFEPSSWELDMVRQCSSKLAFYPSKGGAMLFYNQKPNGELDPMSLHGGCPVLEGTKWGANLWVWNKRRSGLDAHYHKYEINFSNPTSRTVEIYWFDTLMTTLDPYSGQFFYSFEGHRWIIKDGDHILLDFVVSAEDERKRTVTVPPLDVDSVAQSATGKAKPSDSDKTKDEL
ncbi:hypothetical protein PsorP6_001451 [Peronosclerospora sorghi]|uniref:Uncharacterized protein n=1 Tax=Peronosclerospora sorghi TaxID=230839 RepID=A0ACC0WSW2_9STRA|nr:hypothetical protein PsorP6_001451 [Peronosclerospora sorghi]